MLDSERAKLLHETGILPVLYVPEEDFDAGLLKPTDHSTHCPFKGDASYHSVDAGDRVSENAVWTYAHPLPEASWLRGLRGVYADRLDAWLDEDEEIQGHLRDPYPRVDVRRSSRHVRVLAGDTVIADTADPAVLSETGLPNRFYVPRGDVREDALVSSDTTAACPYKGEASYWSLQVNGTVVKTWPGPTRSRSRTQPRPSAISASCTTR